MGAKSIQKFYLLAKAAKEQEELAIPKN